MIVGPGEAMAGGIMNTKLVRVTNLNRGSGGMIGGCAVNCKIKTIN